MRKLQVVAAVIFAAFLLGGCGDAEVQPSATPEPTPTPVSIQSRIAAYADADVSEEDGQLIVGIRVEEANIEAACETFFSQAENIYISCISGSEYTGVSFSLVHNGKVAGSIFVLPDEGGMKVYAPVVFNTDYETAFLTAFYASDFAKSLPD
jgi:hypothetical protein